MADNEILSLMIPYFSLQPLIENAIEHGLLPLENGGKLKLNFSTTSSHYFIEIIDNGIGMNDKKLEEVKKILQIDRDTCSTNHIGLKNCYRRFKLMYGENATFNIDSKPNEGTRIYITISRNADIIN